MRPARLVLAVGVFGLTACNPGGSKEVILSEGPNGPPPAASETRVFNCDAEDGTFTLVWRSDPRGISLFLPPSIGEPHQWLTEVADSGRRFTGDRVRLEIRETEARLEVDGQPYPDCRYDHRTSIWEHAKLNGVDFRAVGNEPGWVMELRLNDRVDFVYDYGDGEASLPVTSTHSDATAQTTEILAGGDPVSGPLMRITLSGGGCADTMSDERFETRVTVRFGERTFLGCGRALH